MVFPARALSWVAATTVVAGSIQACSDARDNAPPQHGLASGTASVTINGQDTGGKHAVLCNQIQWSLMIETPTPAPGFTVLIDTGPEATAKFVKIRDLGGFTGSYWRGGMGDGEATRDPDLYTVTGSAYGIHTDAPNRPTNATYRIRAAC
ncbi:MAG TPA: lipoprotein LpqH [Mycobacterium sp.]|nr:lipoprotein LpqH [Mycobacterium sp.]